MKRAALVEQMQRYYVEHGRLLPWRQPEPDGSYDPYKIVVSEIMLQQTQVDRVLPKYQEFITTFPDFMSLKNAPFQAVLQQWSGLGYNRRARYLQQIAEELAGVQFPKTIEELTRYNGIGKNTAAAVLVYCFNQRHVFVETNVRSVLFYHFFKNKKSVEDRQLYEFLESALPQKVMNYREFYWGLMDYGSQLKRQGVRNISQAKLYRKQSSFIGSVRQLRGNVLKRLSNIPVIAIDDLSNELGDERLETVLEQLAKEGFICFEGRLVRLCS